MTESTVKMIFRTIRVPFFLPQTNGPRSLLSPGGQRACRALASFLLLFFCCRTMAQPQPADEIGLAATPDDVARLLQNLLSNEKTPDPERSAFSDLVRIGPAAIPQIKASLTLASEAQQTRLLALLGRLYRKEDTVLEDLMIQYIEKGQSDEIRATAICGSTCHIRIDRTMPCLVAIIKNRRESLYLRSIAAANLGAFRSAARESIPLLRELLNEDLARPAAINGLGRIGESDASIPRLLISIIDNRKEEPHVRRAAVEAMTHSKRL